MKLVERMPRVCKPDFEKTVKATLNNRKYKMCSLFHSVHVFIIVYVETEKNEEKPLE